MVNVTTPDGRTFTLPRSLAAMSQQGAVPEPAPLIGELPSMEPAPNPVLPPSVTGLMGEPQPTSDVPLQNTPDYKAGALLVPVTPREQRVDNAKYEKQQTRNAKAQSAQAASPQGKLEGVQARDDAAVQGTKEALLGQANVQFAEDLVLADAATERRIKLDGLALDMAKDATKNAAAEESKIAEVTGLRKKIAGTKIDRTADHPILLAISAGLAGFGSSVNGGKVDTLDIIYRAIDRKVNAQMADLDQMAKVYDMSKDELAMLKDKSKSKLEFHSTMFAAEVDKAKRHIEEITARSASAKTKANAKAEMAKLDQLAVARHSDAVRAGIEFDQKEKHHKDQIGVQRAQVGETIRHNMASEQLTRESNLFDYQQSLAASKQKGDEVAFKAQMEAEKEVRQLGVKGADNQLLLNSEGKAQMAQAAQFEADAKAIEDNPDPMARSIGSERVALLKQKAAILRGNARSFGAVKLRNDVVATKVPSVLAASQNMINVIDDIKTMEAGRGLLGRTIDQQKLDALYRLLAVKGKEAWQLGAWDRGSATLSKDIYGGDPSKWDQNTMRGWVSDMLGDDPKGYKDRLEIVAVDLQNATREQLRNHSDWDGKGDLFSRKSAPDTNTPVGKAVSTIEHGRNAVEAREAATPGTFGKIRDHVYSLGGLVGEPQYKVNQRAADNSDSHKYPGLGAGQGAGFEDALKLYKGGDAKAGDQLIATVASNAEGRPQLAIGMLHNLREHASPLYAAARAAVPKGSEVDKQMSLEENNQIGAAMTPGGTRVLAATVLNSMSADGKVTDQDGRNELVRISKTKGHPDSALAAKTLVDIVHLSGVRKTHPGSVMGGK